MAVFLIEIIKMVLKFVAVCFCMGVLCLVFVIVREVAWQVKQESRKQYREKQEKDRQVDCCEDSGNKCEDSGNGGREAI